MFERYTESARRVVFFARYEASQFGSSYIETEHLLLGLLRQEKALIGPLLHSSAESMRAEIESRSQKRAKISTAVDLPLSSESKRVLAYAAEEAERLGHKYIGVEHLLLGMLREEEGLAAELLKARGVEISALLLAIANKPPSPITRSPQDAFSEFFDDLTRSAVRGELAPAVGREHELEAVIEVLAASRKRNPLLIGERGAGKATIIEGLAQRIAGRSVPPPLAEKRILALKPRRVTDVGTFTFSAAVGEAKSTLSALAESLDVIVFLGDLRTFVLGPGGPGMIGGRFVSSALTRGNVQCVATITPDDLREIMQTMPWSAEVFFRPLYVRPLTETETLAAFEARKGHLEKFHGVVFPNEVLALAANAGKRYLPDRVLPGKAVDLLDAAAAHAKLKKTPLPEEILESQRQLKSFKRLVEDAIASHDFKKSDSLSKNELAEKENLRRLCEKYHMDADTPIVVEVKDVEDVIARWGEYPYAPQA